MRYLSVIKPFMGRVCLLIFYNAFKKIVLLCNHYRFIGSLGVGK